VEGALLPQQGCLLGAADDVHERHSVGQADAVEHLTQVGRGRRVHERGVALAPHRLDHAERGQRIDEG
jgi:hypothetical protein